MADCNDPGADGNIIDDDCDGRIDEEKRNGLGELFISYVCLFVHFICLLHPSGGHTESSTKSVF